MDFNDRKKDLLFKSKASNPIILNSQNDDYNQSKMFKEKLMFEI